MSNLCEFCCEDEQAEMCNGCVTNLVGLEKEKTHKLRETLKEIEAWFQYDLDEAIRYPARHLVEPRQFRVDHIIKVLGEIK